MDHAESLKRVKNALFSNWPNTGRSDSEELVTGARYVYVRQPIEITDGMVDRAFAAGAAWFRKRPDGASSDDEWRDFYRTVLVAAELRD